MIREIPAYAGFYAGESSSNCLSSPAISFLPDIYSFPTMPKTAYIGARVDLSRIRNDETVLFPPIRTRPDTHIRTPHIRRDRRDMLLASMLSPRRGQIACPIILYSTGERWVVGGWVCPSRVLGRSYKKEECKSLFPAFLGNLATKRGNRGYGKMKADGVG